MNDCECGFHTALRQTFDLLNTLLETEHQQPVRAVVIVLRADAPIPPALQAFLDGHQSLDDWMRAVDLPERFSYLGGDIVPSLVEALEARYSGPGRRFLAFDVSAGAFPDADLWFCRDCLFHLCHVDCW